MTNKKNPSNDFNKLQKLDKRDFSYEIINLEQEIVTILDKLENRTNQSDNDVILNFLIIRTIVFFETSMAAIAKDIVVETKPDLNQFFKKDWENRITKTEEFLGKKLTDSIQVIAPFNFQNLDDIDFIFSKLLQIPFRQTIQDIQNIKSEHPNIKNAKENFDKIQFIDLFKKRRLISHTHYAVTMDSFPSCKKEILSVMSFIKSTYFLFIAIQLHKENKIRNFSEITKFIDDKLEQYTNVQKIQDS